MDSQISEKVKYTKDLHCKYSSNEVENLTVFNFMTNKFEKSEDWSSGVNGDSLSIGGFNVEITKNKSMFFFGDPIRYGFSQDETTMLLFLLPGCLIKNFIEIGTKYFEFEYKRPSTMWDLAMFIDNYIYLVQKEMDECALDFQLELSDLNHSICETTEDDDLPF